jgi:hypothetical protein
MIETRRTIRRPRLRPLGPSGDEPLCHGTMESLGEISDQGERHTDLTVRGPRIVRARR